MVTAASGTVLWPVLVTLTTSRLLVTRRWLDGKLELTATGNFPFGSLAACVWDPHAAPAIPASATSTNQLHVFHPLTAARTYHERAHRSDGWSSQNAHLSDGCCWLL